MLPRNFVDFLEREEVVDLVESLRDLTLKGDSEAVDRDNAII